jgi:hypothetical protein
MSALIRRKKSTGDVEVPEMKDHPDPRHSKVANCIQYVPIVGMLYDIGATAPTPTQVDRALQMMVLVAALMLTTVASCAASTSFEEQQQAAIRFNTPDTSWHWCAQVNVSALAEAEQLFCERVLAVKDVHRCDNANDKADEFSGITDTVTNGYLLRSKLGGGCSLYGWSLDNMNISPTGGRFGGIRYLVECTNLLAMVVIMNFLMYLSLAASSFKDSTGRYCPDMMWGWWKAMALPIAVSAVMLIGGIIKFFQFYWIMLVVKFPNLYDELLLAAGYSDDELDGYNYTTSYGLWSVIGIAGVSAGCTTIFITVANVLKNKAFVRALDAPETQLMEADPDLVKVLQQAGCDDEHTRELTNQKLTAAGLAAFIDQPVLLRDALEKAGVKCVGDQLAIINALRASTRSETAI